MDSTLNIAYSSDDNYVNVLSVSIVSLLENNKEFKEINIYVVDNNIKDGKKKNITKLVKSYNRNIIFIPFTKICKNLKTDGKFSLSSFSRLFLSNIESIEKIIYIDCDTIIENSLINLWNTNMDGYYIAGVEDIVNKYYRDSIGLRRNEKYINAGLLLINLLKWREDCLQEKFIEFISKFNGSVPHHDQGVINGVCKGKILILEPEYNVMSAFFDYTHTEIMKISKIKEYYNEEIIEKAKQNPIVIHFTDGFKNRPWNVNCNHPLKHRYNYYVCKGDLDKKLNSKELSRNAKIVKKAYELLPFNLYLLFIRSIEVVKRQKVGRIIN